MKSDRRVVLGLAIVAMLVAVALVLAVAYGKKAPEFIY